MACRAEEERLRLAEDVLVKERELKKLRDEKHTMKSQLEQQANFYVRSLQADPCFILFSGTVLP